MHRHRTEPPATVRSSDSGGAGLRESSEQAIHHAMFELLERSIVHKEFGPIDLETAEGRYRFIDGTCFDAPDVAMVGASLAGWLVESPCASAVLTRWRRGARAVLAREDGTVGVAGPSLSLAVDGVLAAEGLVTHDGRLVYAPEAVARRSSGAGDSGPFVYGPMAVERDVIAVEVHDESDRETMPEIRSVGSSWPPENRSAKDGDSQRPTLPPSVDGEAAISFERVLRSALSVPESPNDTRRQSQSAPPAWEMPRVPPNPVPRSLLEARESLDDERESAPVAPPPRRD